ncbi:calcium-binding protein cml38-like [Trifolium pratense]|uniref:Calcium-binding protein cml38-like n=2 Tax=Trifolium pratense TaxID=57577 RepID=A0A2K3LMD0_TRIPR|nr:calcium-binding protein cml38-like [Trifolium pratense]
MGEELLLKEVEMAIEAMDSDGDGYLSLEDLICLMEEGGEEQKLKDLREAFEMYDSENCGFITPKSLKRMLKKMGESKSIDELIVNASAELGSGRAREHVRVYVGIAGLACSSVACKSVPLVCVRLLVLDYMACNSIKGIA